MKQLYISMTTCQPKGVFFQNISKMHQVFEWNTSFQEGSLNFDLINMKSFNFSC